MLNWLIEMNWCHCLLLHLKKSYTNKLCPFLQSHHINYFGSIRLRSLVPILVQWCVLQVCIHYIHPGNQSRKRTNQAQFWHLDVSGICSRQLWEWNSCVRALHWISWFRFYWYQMEDCKSLCYIGHPHWRDGHTLGAICLLFTRH